MTCNTPCILLCGAGFVISTTVRTAQAALLKSATYRVLHVMLPLLLVVDHV